MKNKKQILCILALAISIFFTGCQSSKPLETKTETSKPDVAQSPAKAETTPATTTTENSNPSIADKKADFTVAAFMLTAEFRKKGVTEKELSKYANKVIEVSGRVDSLKEKSADGKPVMFFASGGLYAGVMADFDDVEKSGFKKLTKDQNAKLKCFKDDMIMPDYSPELKNCVVVE